MILLIQELNENRINIFFDGRLPITKRPVRVERLDRSYSQLKLIRLAYPNLTIQDGPRAEMSTADLSEALWSTRQVSSARSTTLTPPFIVPAVIEAIQDSKWADCTSVVPDEAENYCVEVASKTKSAVLSNDSDLLLFPAILEHGVLVRPESLTMSQDAGQRTIVAQVWRPGNIAHALGMTSLTRYAFERSKDSTASDAVIRRCVKTDIDARHEVELKSFSTQYDLISAPGLEDVKLNSLDPRLAELVCQMLEIANGTESCQLQVTLPMLYEDSSRDSSWSYGKPFRSIAFWLLNTVCKSNSSQISELQRKGQRIVEEFNSISSITDQLQTVMECLSKLKDMLDSHIKTNGISSNVILRLWAIQIVVRRREELGKSSYPVSILEQYLGLRSISHVQRQNDSSSWDIMHIHANVDAVLHSFRMLQQAFVFSEGSPSTRYSIPVKQMTEFKTLLLQIESNVGVLKISEIFLDLSRARVSMQTLPKSKLEALLLLKPQNSKEDQTRSLRKVSQTDNKADGFQMYESRQTMKKRKLATIKNSKASVPLTAGSRLNPFALLADDGS